MKDWSGRRWFSIALSTLLNVGLLLLFPPTYT